MTAVMRDQEGCILGPALRNCLEYLFFFFSRACVDKQYSVKLQNTFDVISSWKDTMFLGTLLSNWQGSTRQCLVCSPCLTAL